MAENIQSKSLKKVLILAYSFPPAGGGRVRRAMKFVKYLPAFGWKPIVLTVKKPRVDVYDYTLLKELPGDLTVIRTSSLELPNPFPALRQKTVNAVEKKDDFKFKINTFVFRVLNKIKASIFIPDTRIGWIPFAVFRGIRIAKREKIDAIMVTAEPFSSFISGVMIKLFTQRPLILDYRDEWSENNKYVFSEKGKILRKIEEFLEGICIRYADRVISVTDGIVDNFCKRYTQYKGKFTCITNGFDADDFKEMGKPKNDRDTFTISYTGAIYKRRFPQRLFEAVFDLIKEKPELSRTLRLDFMGEICPETRYLFENSKIKELIRVHGFLNHKDAIDRIKDSNALLYIEDDINNSDRILPAKLFEYMAAKRPVLALVRNGTAKQTVIKGKIGFVADPTDMGELKKTLLELYDSYYKKGLEFRPDDEFINQFSRKDLTAKLASVLEQVTE